MQKESFLTVRIWAVILLIAAFLGWAGITLFAHEGQIIKHNTEISQLFCNVTEIKDSIKDIQKDLKDNIKDIQKDLKDVLREVKR